MLNHYDMYLETSPQVYALSLKRKTIHLFSVLYLKAWTEEVKRGSMLLKAILKDKRENDVTIYLIHST